MICNSPRQQRARTNRVLTSLNVEFSCEFIGRDCPPSCTDPISMKSTSTFPRKTHIHGEHWRCEFRRLRRYGEQTTESTLLIDFWDAYEDAEVRHEAIRKWDLVNYVDLYLCPDGKYRHMTLSAYEVLVCLTCLTKDVPGVCCIPSIWHGDIGTFFSPDEIRTLTEFLTEVKEVKEVN